MNLKNTASQQPDVTVAIMSYNNAHFIGETIESVLGQTGVSFEVIVIDDCSQDNSISVLERYQNDPRFRFEVNPQNLGIEKNSNRCANAGTGRYFVNLGSDDVIYPGHLSSLFSALESHQDAALAYTQCNWIDEDGKFIRFAEHPGHLSHSYYGQRDEIIDLLIHDNYITPSAVMYRRSIFEKIRLPDGNVSRTDILAGDWELWTRIANVAPNFIFLRQATVGYRIHSGQVSHSFYNSEKPLADHTLILELNLANPSIRARMRNSAAKIWAHYARRKQQYSAEVTAKFDARAAAIKQALFHSDCLPGNAPFFSVIITTFNRPRLLIDALRSIENQHFRNFEIILVNDCGEPVEHLLSQFTSVINMIHHGQNRGLSAARNTGLANARGKYIAYLDDDDLMLPDHLAVLADEIECHPETIVYTDADYVTETIEPNRRLEHKRGNPHRHSEFSIDQLMVSNFIPVNTFCHPRQIVDEIGNFDETLTSFEDWEFLLRLAKIRPFFHVAKATVEVRNHATSGESRMLSRNLKNFPALYRKIYSKHPSDNPITQKRRLKLLSSMEDSDQSVPLDKSDPDYFQRAYANLFDRRSQICAEINSTPKKEGSANSKTISMHFLMHLESGAENRLADTLDSLNQQIYANWHLDIVTTIPSPEEISEIPCLGWHTPNSPDEIKVTFDFIVQARKCDWITEIPAGVKIDPLFLWRLANEIGSDTAAKIYFVDDDCFNSTTEHFNPRFKPGVNQEALQSSDLAGPICVQRDIWMATGGFSQRFGSPWFSKLQAVASQFGWDSIKHIPDILFSYPDEFPSDIESCLLGLIENLRARNIDGEIVPVSTRSWAIRYPLPSVPLVSIAIISTGQLDLLSRCLSSVIEKTDYPNLEIIIAQSTQEVAPDLDTWLKTVQLYEKCKIFTAQTDLHNYAARCNAATKASAGDFVLFLKEDSVAIQEKWLEELVRTGMQSGIAGVSPRLIQPGSVMIENAGSVLGLNGFVGNPYQGKTKLGEDLGYLDCIHIARDVSTLPPSCMLIRKESYIRAGCMDEMELGDYLAESDLCLNLRKNGERLIYQPLSNLASSDISDSNFDSDQNQIAARVLSEARSKTTFSQRWFPSCAIDPYWNPNLSLAEAIPLPEIEIVPKWQFLPSGLPRIFAHPIPNGQGDFRVTSPLRALSRAGLVSECICPQRSTGKQRIISTAEILRLKPDSVIVQNYIHNSPLATLQEWFASGSRPFTVYALDDLITDMDPTNPFRKDIPANARARLQYALKRCDRLVVSTDYLADAYRGFSTDIRVVPNRLEQAPWIPLRSQRRTSSKPRIGWAGGSTHHGDLILLKGIIEQTRDQADWIFFGMCPDEIRPLLAEYHAQVKFADYPAYLASLNLDIAVAPLAQTSFNRGKSNLRLLDYGVLGIPVIASDIEPYQNSPACLVDNTVEAWTEAIRARIDDPEAREREGDAMRRWVLADYLLENHLDTWLEAHLPS